MIKIIDVFSSLVVMISPCYSVITIQTMKPSPSKKAMKFKIQDPHPIFLPSSVSSNIDHIRDTKIGHVDLVEFLKRVE